MKEPNVIQTAVSQKIGEKSLTLFIQSTFIKLTGNWEWDLLTDNVYCSDVMMSLPDTFIGTRGIIHPDDLAAVIERTTGDLADIPFIEFRMISTYGKVITLVGEDLFVERTDTTIDALQQQFEQEAIDQFTAQKELEALQTINDIYKVSERFTRSGVWYYNTSTNATWYSNYIFTLHGLPPQSLNAHLNTFHTFIHPDEKEVVVEFMNEAYRSRKPLHLEYRIVTANGIKEIKYISDWIHSQKGEMILCGTIQEISERKNNEIAIEELQDNVQLLQNQLLFDEQNTNIGHWQVYLLTRKTVFTDQFYRIFGLKANSVPPGFPNIVKYIHPDDREAVLLANKKMMNEHTAPELEYRVIRADGKIRYIRQKGKLILVGTEMVITGIVQDITPHKVLESRYNAANELNNLNAAAHKHAEEFSGSATWIQDLSTGNSTWSENFFRLLGFKANTIQLNNKLIQSFVHPEDRRLFIQETERVISEKTESVFAFRLVQRGQVLNIHASARVINENGNEVLVCILKDVTSETNLARQLEHSNQLKKALSENIKDRVIVTDVNHNIILWNKESERVYGTSIEKAIGSNFFDAFPELKTEEKIKLLNSIFSGESVSKYNIKSVLGNGYYDVHLLPLWDDQKIEVTGIIHIIHDVTKETQLRETLNNKLGIINSVITATEDRVITLDRSMNYLYWNKRAEDYYGLKKEDIIGKNILEIFPGFINDPSFDHFRKALRGETVHIQPDFQSPNEVMHSETFLIPIRNEEKEVTGVLWMMRDRHTDYRLQQQEMKSHTILEALNEHCYELDREYRVKYLNPKAEAYFGVTLEEVKDKTVWEIYPAVIGTPVQDAIVRAMENNEAISGEFISPVKGCKVFASIAPTSDGLVVLFLHLMN